MAMNMDAMLRIRADVDGQNKIVALNRGLQSVGTTAAGVTGALRGMTGAAAGLSGALGTLAPLLSAAGLVGMVKGTIDAGNTMYDLSQATGVSVEALARFKKAAATSGTSLEGVSKGLVKLNKAMLDAGTGGKASGATFQALGINVKGANGQLKSADQVMLEVANRFKDMPNGAVKTALALRLFGKSGAELVPMLNMGGDAIDKLKVKMTEAFAQRADEYSDKLTMLSGKVGALGADLTIALLPALEQITAALTVAVTAFNELPAPLKAAAVGAATLAIAWGPLAGALKGGQKLIGSVANGLEILRYQTALAGGVVPLLTGSIQGLSAAILAIPGWGWALAGVAALGLLSKALYDNNEDLRNWANNVASIIATDFSNAMKDLVALGSAAARGVSDAWQSLVDITSSAATAIGNAFAGPFGFIANAAGQVFGSVQRKIAELWNNIPAPIRKALGQAGKIALGPGGYLADVGIRARQMGAQQSVNRAGKGDLGGGGGFTPDLSALESGGGGGKSAADKAKAAAEKAARERQRRLEALEGSQNALAQSKAELAIAREADPVRKIQLEYEEKRRALISAANTEAAKALSLEQEANIQRTRNVDLQKLDVQEKAALADAYKELGEKAHEAALEMSMWGSAAEATQSALAGFRDGIGSYLESIGSLRENISNLSQNVFKGLEDAIVSLTTTGKFSFREFALSVITEMTRMVTRLLIIAPILQLIQSLIPGGSALSGANALSKTKIFPGGVFANGGIMTGDGPVPLRKYAAGGIATSPQLAMFGEGSTPEAYVPFPDGRRIPVAMQGGSGGTTVNVSVDAKGTSVQGDGGRGEQLGRAISQAVQAELIKQRRPGGILAAA